MILRKRTDGKYAAMDSFSRTYAVSDTEDGAMSSLSDNDRLFHSYDDYVDYIWSINFFQEIYYNITYRCNLSCPYCYAPNSHAYISVENNKIIAKKFLELQVGSVVITGGEPLCHPYLSDIINELITNGIENISILTNGTIVNDELCDLMRKYSIEVQISLDGYSEETNAPTSGIGNFTKVMKTVTKLESIGVKYSLVNTLTSENIAFSRQFVDFCEGKGIDYAFFVVKKVGDKLRPDKESLIGLYDYLTRIGYNVVDIFNCVKMSEQKMFDKVGFPITHCGAGITSLTISPAGDAYPCLKMLDNPSSIICNLLAEDAIQKINEQRKIQSDIN